MITKDDEQWILENVRETIVPEKKDANTNSYFERNSGKNIAEERFEKYCKDKSLEWHRFGFDEKKGNISLFYLIPPLLRALPDYIVPTKGQIYFCHIKGTNKFKVEDLKLYTEFERLYCNDKCKLYVFFCFQNETKSYMLKTIREMVKGLTIQRFETDGKEYYSLPI